MQGRGKWEPRVSDYLYCGDWERFRRKGGISGRPLKRGKSSTSNDQERRGEAGEEKTTLRLLEHKVYR